MNYQPLDAVCSLLSLVMPVTLIVV